MKQIAEDIERSRSGRKFSQLVRKTRFWVNISINTSIILPRLLISSKRDDLRKCCYRWRGVDNDKIIEKDKTKKEQCLQYMFIVVALKSQSRKYSHKNAFLCEDNFACMFRLKCIVYQGFHLVRRPRMSFVRMTRSVWIRQS